MNVIGPYAIGFAIGIFVSPVFAVFIFYRLYLRVIRQAELEKLAADLEKRREATDSGRAEQLRPDAGPSSKESNLFVIHPGKLEVNRRQENRKKMAKGLAPWQNWSTLNESGSDSDQTRS